MKKAMLLLQHKIKSSSSNLEGLMYDYYVHLCKKAGFTPVNGHDFDELVELQKRFLKAIKLRDEENERYDNAEAHIRRIEYESHQRAIDGNYKERLAKARAESARHEQLYEGYRQAILEIRQRMNELGGNTSPLVLKAVEKISKDRRKDKTEI
jgi:hypothetical protein